MSTAVAIREIPEKMGAKPPTGWSAGHLWDFLKESVSRNKKQEKKIDHLEDQIEVIELEEALENDPQRRLVSGVAEVGFSLVGGFANPMLVAMLGTELQKIPITEDFGLDIEAVTATGILGLGLFLHWRDWQYGKWVFEAGKGAAVAYAGYIGRSVGQRMALTEGSAPAGDT